jgi:curved DNA-binding protein CbpA
MTSDPLSHLQTLGLEPGASREDVKKAYRDLSKVWHPDRFAGDPALQRKAEEQLKAINEAYRQLESYEPSPDQVAAGGVRPPSGRPMSDRVLRPRIKFNPTERLPFVMTIIAIVVALLLVLTAL